MKYHLAEVMLFNTCNFNCGYCSFATSGTVKDIADMAPFRDRAYIDRVFDFFEEHSTEDQKWILHLSGGEPLLMPNANYFSRKFIDAGHKLGFNTNLSLPIDINGWMEANPVEGVDALIVSLHQEALDHLPAIVQRVQRLKDAGYPLAIRMVAHPKFFAHFQQLEDRFKEMDVSFGVNPLYSPNYPAAYDDEQRETLKKHMKVHYEFVRMNGGMDVSNHSCNAGSKLICVALGNSGRGDVYPCSSTSSRENRLGNIFDGDVELYRKPTACLRSDKCCSCSLHFIHGAVNGVDDTPAQERMLAGYVSGITETLDNWLESNRIKTVYHNNLPQGTSFGERETIYRAPPRSSAAELKKATKCDGILHRPVYMPSLANWILGEDKIGDVQIADNGISITTNELGTDEIFSSPPFTVGPGRTRIDYRVAVKQGAVDVELLAPEGHVVQRNRHQITGTGMFELSIRSFRKRQLRIRVSAATPYRGFSHFRLSPPVAETRIVFSDFANAVVERISKAASSIALS